MANLTQPTDGDVGEFLRTVPSEKRRRDAEELLQLMSTLTGAVPTMWGPSMVGFGMQHLRYESGRDGEWFVVGFAPRASALSVYGLSVAAEDLRDLGPHKTGAGCLYVSNLSTIDRDVLAGLISRAWAANPIG